MGCASSIPVAVGEPVGDEFVKGTNPVVKHHLGGQLEFAPNEAKKPIDYSCKRHFRVIRSTLEPIHHEGIRRRTPVKFSPIRFVLPGHWYKSSEDWPPELVSISGLYFSIDTYISKNQSLEMISCIREKYYLDNELLELAEYLSEKDTHDFIVRTESV